MVIVDGLIDSLSVGERLLVAAASEGSGGEQWPRDHPSVPPEVGQLEQQVPVLIPPQSVHKIQRQMVNNAIVGHYDPGRGADHPINSSTAAAEERRRSLAKWP
jgi:uncharacterized protein with NAD-binding domain and iron-sulfur cluster